MFEVIDDIESIADSCFNLAKTIQRKREGKIIFDDDVNENILKMFSIIDEALDQMNVVLTSDFSDSNIEKSIEIENKINDFRTKLKEEHLINVKNKKYKYKVGVIYNELFSTSEKLGDYVINVSESVRDVRIHT